MRFLALDRDRLGVTTSDLVVDVSSVLPRVPDFYEAGPLAWLLEQGIDHRRALTPDALAELPRQSRSQVRPLAPILRPGKLIGAPVNYLDHKAEMSETQSIADLGVFLKAPSSITGHGDVVELPYSDVRTDQEGELAVIIGRRAHNVEVAKALDYVFGYTCALDISVRSTEDRSTRKSFDTFTPLGPEVVTIDEFDDPNDLRVQCEVSGVRRQDARTRDLIFSVAELVAYSSSVMTLWPGDIIVTGTPAGVGPLAHGDHVAVDVEGVGRLEVTVSDANSRPYSQRPQANLGMRPNPIG